MARFVPLIVLLIWAAVEDVRSRRVPNWLSYTLIFSGLALACVPWRHLRFEQALGGFGLGFGLGMVLYLLRAIGAGDVKLLAGVGAWLGAWPVVMVFAIAAVVGMFMALILGARQGRLGGVLRDGAILGASIAQGSVAGISAAGLGENLSPVPAQHGEPETVQAAGPPRTQQRKPLRGLPFAVAIAGATIVLLVANKLFRT